MDREYLLHVDMDSPRIAVVGAGIIGLTSAVALQEQFPSLPITVIAEKFSPETTADGAAGLWEPYLTGSTDVQLVRKWSHATYNLFQELWQSKKGSKVGLKFMPLTCVSNQEFNEDVKILHQGIPEYKVLNGNQIAKLSREHGNEYRSGFEFNTFTCVPRKLMQHLLAKFVRRGGRVEQRKVASLRELALEGYSVVVNCPGLQAEELVADKNMFPIRGQVVMVQAPWQQEVLVQHSDESSYVVIPNQDSVFLGGTSQKNNRDITVNPSDSRKILDECYMMIPRLKTAKILKEWVGLRPGRISVRLELGDSMTNSNGHTTFVVHNYGHGGSGVTLSWGCALEVVDLLRDIDLIRSHSKL